MCLVTMLYRANVDERALRGGELCWISQEGSRVIVGVGVGVTLKVVTFGLLHSLRQAAQHLTWHRFVAKTTKCLSTSLLHPNPRFSPPPTTLRNMFSERKEKEYDKCATTAIFWKEI